MCRRSAQGSRLSKRQPLRKQQSTTCRKCVTSYWQRRSRFIEISTKLSWQHVQLKAITCDAENSWGMRRYGKKHTRTHVHAHNPLATRCSGVRALRCGQTELAKLQARQHRDEIQAAAEASRSQLAATKLAALQRSHTTASLLSAAGSSSHRLLSLSCSLKTCILHASPVRFRSLSSSRPAFPCSTETSTKHAAVYVVHGLVPLAIAIWSL